jgi:hypothetical protein
VLHFIQDRGSLDPVEKALGVRAQAGYDVGILEQKIGGPGEATLQEPRLPGAPWTSEDDRRDGKEYGDRGGGVINST